MMTVEKKKFEEELKNQVDTSLSLKNADDASSRRGMIAKALLMLPDQQGTKSEIFAKISEVYNVSLTNPESGICKTLNQSLSKYFNKTSLPGYALNLTDIDFSSFELGRDPCMKKMIIAVLLKMQPGNRG